ncbi:hypothetical protein [Pseudohongiella spirulinae]|uniref:Membrane protein n=1 Tax=Pseudohongiella spirulinae TaxID=1249552 RepID=A0A0S2KGL9_9GAMM|nr:hypothetical protein [Pseudohongiella spirulinae]ALO47467.1 membrane protein [Pseudohongiella spirulinae]
MNVYRIVSLICFIPLIVVTGIALADVGLIGIFRLLLDSSAGWQVFVDLASALILTLMFLRDDARRRNIRFWPWVLATLMTGSIAPLLYLIIYGYQSKNE